MVTASPVDFEAFEAYLRRFAEGQGSGEVSPFQRALTFPRFLAFWNTRDPSTLEAHLFPSAGRARRVCLATPLGASDVAAAYREELHQILEELGAEVVDPSDAVPDRPPKTTEEATAIGRAAFQALESCGRMVVVLDGPDVGSQVACLTGYARALGLRIDAIKTDPWAIQSPHLIQVLSAVVDSGGTVVQSAQALSELPWESTPRGR